MMSDYQNMLRECMLLQIDATPEQLIVLKDLEERIRHKIAVKLLTPTISYEDIFFKET